MQQPHQPDRFTEIIGAVAIAHDQEFSGGVGKSADQRRAIASGEDIDDTGPMCAGDELASVGAAVVGDDDFAGEAKVATHHLQGLARVRDAMGQALRLVEARHDDRDIGVSSFVGISGAYFRHVEGFLHSGAHHGRKVIDFS